MEKRVLKYIEKKGKKSRYESYNQELEKYQEIAKANGANIVFTKCSLFFDHKKLNGNAFFKKTIFISAEWAYHLTKFESEEVENAFLVTIGHELTHNDNELFSLRFLKYGFSAVVFLAKINEVRCDFGGAKKMIDSNREKLKRSIIYKKRFCTSDNGNFFHPSWEKRLYYATNYNFDEKLIRQIAKDLKYNNKKVIQMVCDYYDDIILT